MNSRDVVPKNVLGVGEGEWSGSWWGVVGHGVETLGGGGSLSVDMRPYRLFISNAIGKSDLDFSTILQLIPQCHICMTQREPN